MATPSPDTDGVLLADRVPWLAVGKPAKTINVDPKAPWVHDATVVNINPRRIILKGQLRFLQSRMVEIPHGSGHYGYRELNGQAILVGPDNPHVPMIVDYVARTKVLNGLKSAWNDLWLSRNDNDAMRAAAATLMSRLDHYLKETTK